MIHGILIFLNIFLSPGLHGLCTMDLEEDRLEQDLDLSNCFPIQEDGFRFKKSLLKLDNKKLSGTVAFRLKTSVTKALLKENANG